MSTYRIIADEAWTHNSSPLRRYWCVLSGVIIEESEYQRFFNELNDIKKLADCELKWGNLSFNTVDLSIRLIDTFFDGFEKYPTLRFRQLHNVRNHLFSDAFSQMYPDVNIHKMFGVEGQFKIYYQYIKHCFGLEHLPSPSDLLLMLDDYSSRHHKADMELFTQNHIKGLPNINESRILFVKSSRNGLLSAVDFVGGAFGFKANRMDAFRENGQRGMNKRQKLRLEVAEHIRKKLQQLSLVERPDTRIFNWSETTGRTNCLAFRLSQKVRIWKFIPSSHYYDKGWDNDHLIKQLYYADPKITHWTTDAGQTRNELDPHLVFKWMGLN